MTKPHTDGGLLGDILAAYGGEPDAIDVEELLVEGQVAVTIAVLPASAGNDLRSDLVCVPVTDAAPIVTMLAWPERSTSRPLAAFVRVAAGIAAKHRQSESTRTPVRSARATPQS